MLYSKEGVLKKIIFTLGDTGSEALYSIINNKVEEAVAYERENGIINTTAALKDAKVNEEDILTFLQKHWNICRDEADDYLKVKYPYRELKSHLYKQGLNSDSVENFMKSNMVRIKLRHNQTLWKLSPGKLMKEIEKNKLKYT